MNAPLSPNNGNSRSAFREVPYMGVIHVVAEAVKLGFENGHPDWSNLGQGQPEVGPLEGAPARLEEVHLKASDHAYGPLEGLPELREQIAAHYNRLYRRGRSLYTVENVAVAQGGRLALTRAMAALDAVNMGYQIPDYTAYEDMLNVHLARLNTIMLRADESDGFLIPAQRFANEVKARGLGAFILSNPCNPTGALLEGEALGALVESARSLGVNLLMDEFYSHFIYNEDGSAASGPVSAAAYVEDIEKDPVILFDGLTKSFRYPGWRLGWSVGPKRIIENLARTASAIDGGPSCLVQRAALSVLEPKAADAETQTLRRVFAEKRRVMLQQLGEMGIRIPHASRGTFYCWGSLENLPAPYNIAQNFFRQALAHKVMTVPGEYFDINPGHFRKGPSQYRSWMRFSFGPPMDNMRMGLERLKQMLSGESLGRPVETSSDPMLRQMGADVGMDDVG